MNGFLSPIYRPVRIWLLLFALASVVLPPQAAGARNDPDILNAEERAWLAGHPVIRVIPERNYAPFIFIGDDGKPQGISMDYLRLIGKKLAVTFRMEKGENLADALKKLQQGQADVITSVMKNEERSRYLIFTSPYISVPAVIIVKHENRETLSPEKLTGYRVAVGKGYAVEAYLREKYPGLRLVPVDDEVDGLKMLSFSEVDAIVADTASASYIIDRYKITNLRIAGDSGFSYDLGFASRKDRPILNGILEKGLSAITPAEREEIYSRWVRFDQPMPFTTKVVMAGIVFLLISVILLSISIYAWNRSLARKVREKTDDLSRELLQRQATEEVLKESERRLNLELDRLALILKTAQDGFWIVDAETGRYVDVNEAACLMLGYTREEMLALRIRDVEFQMTPREIAFNMRKIREDGHAAFSTRHRTKSGGIIDVEVMVNYLPASDQCFSFVRNITERKEAEEALRKSEEKYRLLIDTANEGIWVMDACHQTTYVNQAMIHMLGYDQGEIIGRSVEDFLFPEDTAQHEQRMKERHAGRDEVYECRFRRKDGSELWALVSAKAVRDDQGRFSGSFAMLTDITARKRGEEERIVLQERLQRAEKMEALGLLAGGVAHDLNNALGILVGYAELLYDKLDESDPRKADARNIVSGGERAATIVQDLLTLARRGVQTRTAINLNKAIREYVDSPEHFKMLSLHPNVRLRTELENDLLRIKGSQVHIAKTLMNLVLNAAEAMTSGGTIVIRTENRHLDRQMNGYETLQEGDYVILTVSDNGEGIGDDDLKHIFEPFYTKKAMGRSGTGLGLSVVWGTVKDHDGYIDVESVKGKGTTFRLYFPVTHDEEEEQDVPVSEDQFMGRGEKILVVDDMKAQRDLAEIILSRLRYSVDTVPSGEEAVEYLRSKNADLIVLDMIMDGGIDGFETYRRIAEIRPGQKAVIVSGFAETDRVKMAQSLGAGTFVRKPYIKERIGLAVRKELDKTP